VVKFGYTYVADENNIYRKTFDHRSGDPYNEYTYDDLDRLTDVTYHDSDTEAFVMDALGNRTGNQTLRDDGSVNFTVDSATNRYTAIGGNSISHDDAGNMNEHTRNATKYHYDYDYENRVMLIKKETAPDTWAPVAEYDYDALGRRIRVKKDFVDSVPSVVTLFYYNPDWQVLAEYDGSNNLQCYFVYGNYIDEPLIMHRQSDGEDYFYGQDHLYSTVILIDDDGNVIERYEYDAYGTTHIMDASYNPRTTSSYGNPYTFTGRELDVLDGGDLLRMHYRHRDYDAYAGRFLQKDPLDYIDGSSLYEYVMSNPCGLVDANGQWGSLIHETATRNWALRHTRMRPWAAASLGAADESIDHGATNPVTTVEEALSWHFNEPYRSSHTWDAGDSRFDHSEQEVNLAVASCQAALVDTANADQHVGYAVMHLGRGLHPLQDWVAHGTWIPHITALHISPVHPEGTDDPTLGFAYAFDRMLRDWEAFGETPPEPRFVPSTDRLNRTKAMTIVYVNAFKASISNTPCRCKIFF
jgi:RHS repeat-associated protein